MKPDLVLQYCVYCDYPLYRSWLKKYRDKFNKVIIYPSRHHGKLDLEEFAKSVLPETWINDHVIDWTTSSIDWRQAEIEPCLEQVESDWIWFSEQDFFCKDWDKLFTDIDKAKERADMIGLWNPTNFPYIHPSLLIIKKEMLDKTDKDFRAHPGINGSDHFAMITKDVQRLGGKIVTLQDMGYNCDVSVDADCFHLGGLTYVYQDWKGNGTDHFGVKSPEAFRAYNSMCMLQKDIETNSSFFNLCWEVQQELEKRQIHFDYQWEKFFKL